MYFIKKDELSSVTIGCGIIVGVVSVWGYICG